MRESLVVGKCYEPRQIERRCQKVNFIKILHLIIFPPGPTPLG